jgi:hypothetical protein
VTTAMHPPAVRRCQIYSEATSVRCINEGTHWVSWGGCQHFGENHGAQSECDFEYYSWECDGTHLYGEAA